MDSIDSIITLELEHDIPENAAEGVTVFGKMILFPFDVGPHKSRIQLQNIEAVMKIPSHPNIPRMIARVIDVHANRYYALKDPGETFLSAKEFLSAHDVVTCLEQLEWAIRHLHNHNIAHGNITEQSMRINRYDTASVLLVGLENSVLDASESDKNQDLHDLEHLSILLGCHDENRKHIYTVDIVSSSKVVVYNFETGAKINSGPQDMSSVHLSRGRFSTIPIGLLSRQEILHLAQLSAHTLFVTVYGKETMQSPMKQTLLTDYYQNGTTLDKVIHGSGNYTLSNAFDYLSQIAHGVRYLRDHNLVHGSLCPQNILKIGRQIKILQLENVFNKKRDTRLFYLHPDNISFDKKCCADLDLYSLKMIASEILTRQHPAENWKLKTLNDTILQIQNGKNVFQGYDTKGIEICRTRLQYYLVDVISKYLILVNGNKEEDTQQHAQLLFRLTAYRSLEVGETVQLIIVAAKNSTGTIQLKLVPDDMLGSESLLTARSEPGFSAPFPGSETIRIVSDMTVIVSQMTETMVVIHIPEQKMNKRLRENQKCTTVVESLPGSIFFIYLSTNICSVTIRQAENLQLQNGSSMKSISTIQRKPLYISQHGIHKNEGHIIIEEARCKTLFHKTRYYSICFNDHDLMQIRALTFGGQKISLIGSFLVRSLNPMEMNLPFHSEVFTDIRGFTHNNKKITGVLIDEVEGTLWRNVLKNSYFRLDLRRVYKWMKQLAEALEMITPYIFYSDDYVLASDSLFILLKDNGNGRQAVEVILCQHIRYMAPERFSTARSGKQAETVYSLGTVIWELLEKVGAKYGNDVKKDTTQVGAIHIPQSAVSVYTNILRNRFDPLCKSPVRDRIRCCNPDHAMNVCWLKKSKSTDHAETPDHVFYKKPNCIENCENLYHQSGTNNCTARILTEQEYLKKMGRAPYSMNADEQRVTHAQDIISTCVSIIRTVRNNMDGADDLRELIERCFSTDPKLRPSYEQIRDFAIQKSISLDIPLISDDFKRTGSLEGGQFANIDIVEMHKRGSVIYKQFKIQMDSKLRKREIETFHLAFRNRFFPSCFGIVGTFDRIEGVLLEKMRGDMWKEIILNKNLKYGSDDMITWSFQISSGLLFLHNNGVIHRDLKPDNVLVDQDLLKVKLSDFGVITASNRTTDIRGTPAYWPPEAAEMEELRLNSKFDIFSFGATLYELVERKQFHRRQPGPVIVDLHLDAADLSFLIERCCSDNPHLRPDTKQIVEYLKTRGNFKEETWAPVLYLRRNKRGETKSSTI